MVATEGRDYNDSDILRTTVQEQDGDKVRYSSVLPSGRKVSSEWMRQNDMKGSTVITWCEFVREQINVDKREAEAVKKRPPLEEDTDPLQSPEDSGEDLPEALIFAISHRDKWLEKVTELETWIVNAKIERKQARREYEQWESIVNGLRGEVDE